MTREELQQVIEEGGVFNPKFMSMLVDEIFLHREQITKQENDVMILVKKVDTLERRGV